MPHVVAAGPFFVVAALLGVAGVAKVRRPAAHRPGAALAPASRARSAWPGVLGVGRGGRRGRLALASAGRRPLLVVAAAYVAFAVRLHPAHRPARPAGGLRLLRRRLGARSPTSTSRLNLGAAACSPGSPRCGPPTASRHSSPTSQPPRSLLVALVAVGVVARLGRLHARCPSSLAAARARTERTMTGAPGRGRDRGRSRCSALLVVGLLRSHAEILRRLHDLGVDLDDARRTREPCTRDQFNVFPEVPSPGPTRRRCRPGRDLSGVDLADGAVSVRVVGAPHTHADRLPVRHLPHLRALLGRVRPAGRARPLARRAARDRDQGPRRGEPGAHRRRRARRGIPLVMSREAWDGLRRARARPTSCWSTARPGQARGEGTGIDWPQVRGLLDAGQPTTRCSPASSRRGGCAKPAADDARERRVDAELMAAGIRPGDPASTRRPTPSGDATTEPGYRRRVRLTAHGITTDLPAGWEGRITRRRSPAAPTGRRPGRRPGRRSGRPTRSPSRSSTSPTSPCPRTGATSAAARSTVMGAGHVFVTLFEYGPESVGQALFARQGIPTLRPRMFAPTALQKTIAGQAGCQRFFTVQRPGLLPLRRARQPRRGGRTLVPKANAVLRATTIGPR